MSDQDVQDLEDVVVERGSKSGGPRLTGIKDLAGRLYRGEAGVDVVGKRKIFYAVAGAILLIFVVTITFSKFNLGIEFHGGESFTVPASVGTMADVRDTISNSGAKVASAQTVGGQSPSYLVKT